MPARGLRVTATVAIRAEWSADPQPVGLHPVLDGPLDVDAVRAVTHRYTPDVAVELVPPLPPEAFDTPHRSVARLAALVRAHQAQPDVPATKRTRLDPHASHLRCTSTDAGQ